MPPKEYNSNFQKVNLNGTTLYVEHGGDVYNIYNEQLNLIEEINGPLEGLCLVEALNKIVAEIA